MSRTMGNIEYRTLNTERRMICRMVFDSMFSVRCSAFNVQLLRSLSECGVCFDEIGGLP